MDNYHPLARIMSRTPVPYSPQIKKFKNKYMIILNAQKFKPEDVSVTVSGRKVTVVGKHVDGSEVKQFKRRYMFPEICNMDRVNSTFSTNGILTITAPKMVEERIVNIQIIDEPESVKDDETEMSEEY